MKPSLYECFDCGKTVRGLNQKSYLFRCFSCHERYLKSRDEKLKTLGLRFCIKCKKSKKIKAFFKIRTFHYGIYECKSCIEKERILIHNESKKFDKANLTESYIREYMSKKYGRSFTNITSWRSKKDQKLVELERIILETKKLINHETNKNNRAGSKIRAGS